MPEVITISDDSDNGISNDYNYTSDDSDIVLLSVSSPAPEPPSSSQPRSASWGDVSGIWESSGAEDDLDSDAELPDPAALVMAGQSQWVARQRSGITSGPQSQIQSSVSTTPGGSSQWKSSVSDSEDLSPVVDSQSTRPIRRRKKTEEEKTREKAEKDARKLAKQEEAKAKREATAAKKAAERLVKKAHKDANKLVTDKKSTLKDMALELSSSLIHSSLYATLLEKMQEFDCLLAPIADGDAVVCNPSTGGKTNLNALGIQLVRWKRRVKARYDEHLRQWLPLEEGEQYTRTEGTYLIFVAERDVRREPSVTEQVHRIRTALGSKHHVHLMLCGWKPSRKEERELVEQELVRLQVRSGIFVEQVPNIDEAVNWIYNMTADLGIKPHKLIDRSHLPFCAVASSTVKVGKSDEDTMVRMLTQLPRLTDPAAKAMLREYGTINRIMEAYHRLEVESPREGPMMLADVEVNRTQKGKEASRVLNKALSERLYSLLWGNDPKALVN